ncbi:hypothetical protein RBG07_10675 [Klebsiella aerogenes]|uniref:hypothetical protein n=1 Tax=Klebsiella aerogenes TaxID=548 RepID=UPI0028DFC511|nr:hypothetical protein [Klebsiella aerogenes]MDT8882991.1 hypothetical protein [Klebsiella aerogenes]
MNNAFPGERLNTRIHSQLSLHIEIEPRAVELTLKLLAVSRFDNIKAYPIFVQEKINTNNNNSSFSLSERRSPVS